MENSFTNINTTNANAEGENMEKERLQDILSALNLDGNNMEENLLKTILFLTQDPGIVIVSYEFHFKLKGSNNSCRDESDVGVLKQDLLSEEVGNLSNGVVGSDHEYATYVFDENFGQVRKTTCQTKVNDVSEPMVLYSEPLKENKDALFEDVHQSVSAHLTLSEEITNLSNDIKVDQSLRSNDKSRKDGEDRQDEHGSSGRPKLTAFIEEDHIRTKDGQSKIADDNNVSKDNIQKQLDKCKLGVQSTRSGCLKKAVSQRGTDVVLEETEIMDSNESFLYSNAESDVKSISSASHGLHSKLIPKENKSYKCQECEQAFEKLLSLAVHELSHTPAVVISEYMCPHCDFRNYSFTKLKEHMSQKHSIDSFLHCPSCSMIFLSPEDLASHKTSQKHKGAFTKKYFCSFCPYGTDLKDLLMKHIERLHSGDNKYKCKDCSASFREEFCLKDHVRQEHDTDYYFCIQCGVSSEDKDLSGKHYSKIHGGRYYFFCVKCGYSAKKHSVLRKHMQTHTNSFPVKCPVCGRCFRTKNDLDKHLPVHNTEKRFACHLCPFKAKSKRNVREHLRSHSETKNFKCGHCDYATNYPCNLSKHQKRHSDLRPYVCNLCPCKFKLHESLKKHLETVHSKDEKEKSVKTLLSADIKAQEN